MGVGNAPHHFSEFLFQESPNQTNKLTGLGFRNIFKLEKKNCHNKITQRLTGKKLNLLSRVGVFQD